MTTLQALIVGGVLTFIGGLAGGLGGSWLLAFLEHRRERQRQHERHTTAVRIVVFELRRNGAALILQAAGGRYARMTSTAHDSHATDLYAELPRELAEEVASAYDLASLRAPATPLMAKDVADRVLASQLALEAYGETQLGMKFFDRRGRPDSAG